MTLIVNCNKETTRASINDTKLLASQSYSWRINDGHHIFYILRKDSVKQPLVTILQKEMMDYMIIIKDACYIWVDKRDNELFYK